MENLVFQVDFGIQGRDELATRSKVRQQGEPQIMAFKKTKRKSGISKKSFEDAFAGIVEAGFLMAAADGQLEEQEMEVLGGAISGMIEDASEEDIAGILEQADELLASDGWEARCEKVGALLAGNEKAAEAAMKIVALVYMCDQESDDEWDEYWYALGEALGYDNEEADEVYSELEEEYL